MSRKYPAPRPRFRKIGSTDDGGPVFRMNVPMIKALYRVLDGLPDAALVGLGVKDPTPLKALSEQLGGYCPRSLTAGST